MANHVSSIKRARQTVKKTAVNSARKSRVRTAIKAVEAAILAGDKAAAEAAMKIAEPEMARGVSKGVIEKNTCARKVSRLVAAIRKIGTVAVEAAPKKAAAKKPAAKKAAKKSA
jgi:small subunit ribosomal protein S20